jgi:MATE family multidrug resistance protein
MPPESGSSDEILINEDSPLLPDQSKASNDATPHGSNVGIFDEISEQMATALPTLQSMVLTKLPWLISIRFVGGLGTNELAAAALATTLCNVTGLSFSVGLSSALTTLSGQAKGNLLARGRQNGKNDLESCDSENNQEPLTPLVYLFRGLVIQLAIVIPIGMWWINGTESSLISLGQEDTIANMTDAYLRILAPGLWSYSISWTLTAWVQSIGMADVPVYAAILGLAVHIPLNWFFIDYIHLGYLGCAVATVCFQMIQVG